MQTKQSMDAAISIGASKLLSQLDARLKRQMSSLKETQEAVAEVEAAIKDIDSKQRDLLEESRKDNHETPSKAKR